MDNDLEDILNGMWVIKPKQTIDYLKAKTLCKLIQEVRNLKLR